MANKKVKNPSVSVIIPAYNEEKYIGEAIESILEQTFTDFELIIVDDGSTDKTFDIATSYNDSRLQVYRQENAGPAKARNKALQKAIGKFIALQDADDRSKPERLKKQYKFLVKNLDYIAVGTNASYIEKNGEFIFKTDKPLDVPKGYSWNRSACVHPSVMFRKNVLEKVGGYPNIPVSQDTFFLYKMNKQGQFHNIQESLYEYRITPTSISRKNKQIKNLVHDLLKKFRETGRLDEAKVNELNSLKSNQTADEKLYEYHLLLAKKYLWNNYKPKKSKKNLRLAITYSDNIFNIELRILFLVTFLKEKNVKCVYELLKGNVDL